jgi:hypothetical protein
MINQCPVWFWISCLRPDEPCAVIAGPLSLNENTAQNAVMKWIKLKVHDQPMPSVCMYLTGTQHKDLTTCSWTVLLQLWARLASMATTLQATMNVLSTSLTGLTPECLTKVSSYTVLTVPVCIDMSGFLATSAHFYFYLSPLLSYLNQGLREQWKFCFKKMSSAKLQSPRKLTSALASWLTNRPTDVLRTWIGIVIELSLGIQFLT